MAHRSPAARAISPYLGNRKQLRELFRLFTSKGARLVTLGGYPGVGKTRLAQELLRSWEKRSESEGIFVPLGSVSDSSEVIARIGQRLALPEVREHDLAGLVCRALNRNQALVVLDNVEQILDIGESLLVLLDSCPNLRICLTSRRVPLQLPGEVALIVDPLDVPPADITNPQHILRYSAVEWFLLNAVNVDREQSLDAIAQICRHVQGNPLALKLLAGWTVTYRVEEIASDIEKYLAESAANGIPAHSNEGSTLAALETSYALLSDQARRALQIVSIWPDGVARDAFMEATEAPDGILQELLWTRLLEVDREPGRPARIRLHPLTEQFARLKLGDGHAFDRAIRLRAQWAEALMARLVPTFYGTPLFSADGNEIAGSIDDDRINLNATIDHALASDDVATALRLCAPLSDYWYRRGRVREGRSRLERTVRSAQAHQTTAGLELAKSMTGLALMCDLAGERDVALECAHQALEVAQTLRHDAATGEASGVLGYVALGLERFEESIAFSLKALDILGPAGLDDRSWQCDLHENLAMAYLGLDSHDLALTHALRAAELAREVGDDFSKTESYSQLGDTLLANGKAVEAVRTFRSGFETGQRAIVDRKQAPCWLVIDGLTTCALLSRALMPEQTELTAEICERVTRVCRNCGFARPPNRVLYTRLLRSLDRTTTERPELGDAGEPRSSTPPTPVDLDTLVAEIRTMLTFFEHASATSQVKNYRDLQTLASAPDSRLHPQDHYPDDMKATVRLTQKQRRVLHGLAGGLSVKEIAAEEGVGESTIYDRIARIRSALTLPENAPISEVVAVSVHRHLA